MKKNLLALFVGIMLVATFIPSLVLAQETPVQIQNSTQQPTSLLPTDAGTGTLPPGVTLDCVRFLKRPTLRAEVITNAILPAGDAKVIFLDKNGLKVKESYDINPREMALSCGIKTGRIDMWLVPFYLVRVIDFGLLLAGLLSVLFIVIGGYHFIIGSYTEDKEKGKKTILYALGGLALCLLAYTIVNLILLFVTA